MTTTSTPRTTRTTRTPTGKAPPNLEEVHRRIQRILALVQANSNPGAISAGAQQMTVEMMRLPADAQRAALTQVLTVVAKSSSQGHRKVLEENERLKQPPHKLAVFDQVAGGKAQKPVATVGTHEGLIEVPVSTEVEADELVPGQEVVLAQNGAVLAARGLARVTDSCEFDRLLDDGRILVRAGSGQMVVLSPGGELLAEETRKALQAGDLIEYVPGTRRALRAACRSVRTREFLGEAPDVTREDIGGLDDVWAKIEQDVLGPICHPELYRKYGVGIQRGVVFHGPPGVGKTMLVKAAAQAVLAALGLDEKAEVLFTVSGSALLRPYVGEGEAIIRGIAETAEKAAAREGFALVLLDDFEYAGLHRGVGDRSSPAYSTLPATLINSLDGLGRRDAPVSWMATANRIDLVDSALLRSGRFGTRIAVPRPDLETCKQIVRVHVADRPLADELTIDVAAERLAERVFSTEDDNLLLRIQYADAEQEEIFPPRVISGAILADAVRAAANRAIRRELEDGDGAGGIRLDDMINCLDAQLRSTVAAVTPGNAHLHYLDLPADRRVAAVDHVKQSQGEYEENFVA